MDSNFVASEIVGKLRQNHTARIQDLWDIIHTKYKHELSYYKDSSTQYNYHTIPRPYENSALLRYVYWAFAPCIAAFQYCRPVISIDGTHLYSKNKGVLMIAMTTDANQKVLPLAFVVVDKESEWPRRRDGTEQVYHRYCLRHVASNFNRRFDDPVLKALSLKAGYATHEAKFESLMQIIKEAEINLLRGVDLTDRHVARCMPYTYLISEDFDKWSQSHDGGRRYGAMTTNISECFNGVLKGARSLPIVAMVEFTWSKLVAYFHNRHKKITEDLSRGHTVRNFNHETGVYQVLTPYNDHRGGGGNHSHEVHVFDRICGCGKWQNLKIPCSHAIKVLQGLHLDAISYIDPCYSLNNAIHTYSHNFVVPKSESLWRDVRGPRWVPDPQLLRAKGRPVASRIRNEMDGVWRERGSRREDPNLREIQPRQRCGVCHQEGHNRRSCPNSHGASTSGSATN
ncbi:uncharacterized protein LOC142635440 [Castanea sativa]|uniref:uncharacterized protein LOC142635440 n=1 Tax=Castanea sativa TaxID=21020 RepID=UPI003F652B19